MSQIPQDTSFDSTFALLFDPYQFISKRCQAYDSDIFETRLLLQKVICMRGKQAAKLFYDPQYFIRKDATPSPIRKTLLGAGGIQNLDGEPHKYRKQMFMSFMTPENIDRLVRINTHCWENDAASWESKVHIHLYETSQKILFQSVCEWAGVPLKEEETKQRTQQFVALFDGAGSIGIRHLQARLSRWRANKWMAKLIEQIRSKEVNIKADSIASTIAWHRDLKGQLLDSQTAAVELINILRPTVAVSVFITFMALALYRYPDYKEQKGYSELFIQEVRRFYPFFPSLMAFVSQDFTWNGYYFPKGRRVILDLYGTNHDPKEWQDPEIFRPERFGQWNGCPFNFIPQGGGDHYQHHRCPGEWITIELLKVALKFLTTHITYDVPQQDLTIDMSRLPALPKSGFIITNVKLNSQAHFSKPS
jgi:fatty-acid peroxygenase